MSFCKITFCGLNVARFVASLCKQGIKVWDVSICGKQAQLTIDKRNGKHVVAQLKQKCYNVVQVTYFGNVTAVDFVKRHFVVVVALLLAVVFTVVLSNYCCKIVVTGDFDQIVVNNSLADLGVALGVNLKKLNVDRVENALANKLGAMYAVLTKRGSVLYVNVIAKKALSPPIDMHSKRDILATCDGVVNSVLCEQGTPLVKEGDFVKKGDVLIAGLRTFTDGTQSEVYALGRVCLTQSVSAFAEYTGTLTQLQRTGKTFCATQVVLFGKAYGKGCDFEHYEVEYTSTCLYPLNLQIQRATYYQMAYVTTPATFEECLPFLMQQALQMATVKRDFVVTRVAYQQTIKGVTAILYGDVEIS